VGIAIVLKSGRMICRHDVIGTSWVVRQWRNPFKRWLVIRCRSKCTIYVRKFAIQSFEVQEA